ncbi:penicillin-binding protein [Paenibacillus lemnae]|uniref:PASTA domain-containing protein n=1 Tax=Paenibacillus lemnae TaxID=1330551 RepID=A0A848M4R9_PAELE|nr:PASTA domain-containing penicillin-binding protein [Paenibacillus lemnae]NMO94783.1 PASTA domain-containing protein [Paenibacillus lemnae]
MIKKIKMRSLLIGGLITLFFALLIGRIFWLQVVDNDVWRERAMKNWDREQKLTASRGTIADRDGDILAMDAPAYTVVVNPKVIQANDLQDEVVKGLHKVLGKKEDELVKLVTAKDSKGNYLVNREVRNEGWKINEDKRKQVEALRSELEAKLSSEGKVAESGIDLISQNKRFYPRNSLAAHILGYTDRQGAAKDGFELRFDEELKGVDGFAKYKSDKKGVKLPSADDVYQPAKNGKNIKLTIDDTIQYFIEDAMREAYEEIRPVSMTVIAADPNTMEILGMANLPTFDPNTYWDAPDYSNYYNHAIRSTYEPGSTFKIVTLASAIQENLFDPNAYYQSGSIRAGGRTHYDIKRDGWGMITYLEGVKRSSNVAFVKLGYEMLGKERLTNYINLFGFNEKTGIDLPGEGLGVLNMSRDIDISTVPYGYAVSVTPIQQIAAISAVANGGKLLKPQIVKEIQDPNTGDVQVIQPELIRQIITPEAARKTGGYLEQVVADQKQGTGWKAYIDGYRVAGKTGTSVKGDYSDTSKLVASFIGYAPVDDPKIAVIVIVDEPNEQSGGGAVAAPVFQKIVSQSLKYWGVPKTEGTDEKDKEQAAPAAPADIRVTPDLSGMKTKDVRTKLLAEGFVFEVLGSGSTLVKQYPAPGDPISTGQRIYLMTEDAAKMKIPDMRGESLRDALEILTLLKVKVNVKGEGYIVDQKETKEKDGRVVYLTLQSAAESVKEKEGASTEEEADPSGSSTEEEGEE